MPRLFTAPVTKLAVIAAIWIGFMPSLSQAANTAPPSLALAFSPANILTGDTSSLTFTVTNPNSAAELSSIGFSCPLPAGLVVANPNGLSLSGFAEWAYKVPISIVNTGATALSSYQVPITLDTASLVTAGKTLASGNDIRFTDALGANLPYWIESGMNTATTVIWVKVNAISPSDTTTIYLLYGNPSATAVSNGDDTFELFDDFSGLALDTGKWTAHTRDTGSITVAGGQVTFNTTNFSSATIVSNSAFPIPCISEIKVNALSGSWPNLYQMDNGVYSNGAGLANNAGNMYLADSSDASPSYAAHSSYGVTPAGSKVGKWSVVRTGTSATGTWPGGSLTSSTIPAPTQDQQIAMGLLETGTGNQQVDWCRVRQYYATGTTQSVGAESASFPGTVSADASSSTISLSGGTLPGGSSGTITVNVTGTSAGLKTIPSLAITSTEGGDGASSPASLTVTSIADLAITKTDNVTTVTPGGSVTYTITASNAGPDAITGATVADILPASLTATWTAAGAAGGTTTTTSGSGNINALVDLPSGSSVTYTVTATISAFATGDLTNTATITAPDYASDPTPGNNSATDTDTLDPQADLTITKTDDVTTAVPGGSVTYTITATNQGPSDAPGATVADTFPASLTATWTSVGTNGGSGTASGSGNINDTINLPAGGSVTYTVTATISPSATGSLSNTATVTAPAGVTDPVPGNNSATDTDTLAPQADLAITKTDGVTSLVPGGSVTYTITASNAGLSNVTGATVADTLPDSLSAASWTAVGAGGGTATASGSGNINDDTVNLPAGGSVTYTVTAQISASATDSLSNTATITVPGGVTDPTPANNSATDTDTLAPLTDNNTGLIISEFRLRGPNGANDEFVELYNKTEFPITVQVTDTSAGWALAASDGTARFVIPTGTIIPPHGHYLGTNSDGYSLGGYAAGDATFTTDIPDNAGIALFKTSYPANFTLVNRLDAVGSTSEANTLYKEGTGYPALSPFSINYSFYRTHLQGLPTPADPAISLVDGEPHDSDNNAVDFIFVDTNGTSAGAGQLLGAPGPENRFSPIAGYHMTSNIGQGLVDPAVDHSLAPNRVKVADSDPPNNSTFGSLAFNRTFTNNTGAPLSRLRFRIVKLTTFPAPSGIADLRPITSSNVDVSTVGGPVTVLGTTLETPPSQPNGGGWNSTLSAATVTDATPLEPGASISLRFLFGIQQPGTYRIALLVEGLPDASHFWYLTGHIDHTADSTEGYSGQSNEIAIAEELTSVKEGSGSGTTPFKFTVSHIGDTTNPVTVHYAVSGAAVDTADFGGSLPSGDVIIPAGSASTTVTIPVSQDSLVEPDESFTVTLSNPDNGATLTTAAASSTIANDDSSTTLASSANPAVTGQGVTFTATVNAGGGTATGTVTFSEGASTLGTAPLVAGHATFSTNSLSLGSHGITAVYAGDGNFNGSTSESITQIVEPKVITGPHLIAQRVTTCKLNRQNGLFEMTVKVTNTTAQPINGFRLLVDYRDYKIAYPNLKLFKAKGSKKKFKGYIDYPFPVAANGVVSMKLRFYSRNRTLPKVFKPKLKVKELEADQVTALKDKIVPVRSIQLPDKSIRIKFPSVIGKWYHVRYSEDKIHWHDCLVPIKASTTRTQWIDSGPPFTDAPPSQVASRYYRVNEIAAP